MRITFPSLTAKQIVKKYNNKLGKDNLLYDIDWYENEDFYTKEKCRKGTQEIITDLTLTFGKTWDGCNKMTNGTPIKMLNFAELLWCVIKIPNFLKNEYSWTSSHTSSGGFLVFAGSFGDVGGGVVRNGPSYSSSNVGCAFSAVALKSSSIDTLNGDEASSRGGLPEVLEINGIKYNLQ